jgi:hypothetical protein
MERAHRLLAEDNLDAPNVAFWSEHWPYIASAKVPLEKKVAAYRTLKLRDIADIRQVSSLQLYDMIRADRAFVAAVDLNISTSFTYHLYRMWIDDDVAAFAKYTQERTGGAPTEARSILLQNSFDYVLSISNPPRCMRFLFEDKGTRELAMRHRMSPLMRQLVEELVQPTDQFNRWLLLRYGQSVKLIGMCVKDEELVEAWLNAHGVSVTGHRITLSVMLARKLHALATSEQRTKLEIEVLSEIMISESSDGVFELVWLFGLLGPSHPLIQECFLKNQVSAFPALTFAMIVAMCDGYLETAREITESQRRFFTFVARLPMDLQALVSLRLWKHTSTVIQGEKFDRAFLTII